MYYEYIIERGLNTGIEKGPIIIIEQSLLKEII
jgi:hypothetical protein